MTLTTLCLFISVFSFLTSLAAGGNVTSYFISPGSKVPLCGYYTLDYQMWASTTTAHVYVTDTACNSLTAAPCQPSPAVLQPPACLAQLTCSGKTSHPSTVPLCLVIANRDPLAVLEVNLLVSGSLTPDGGGSSDTSSSNKDFATLEVALVAAGAGVGLIILAGLAWLMVWLLRCRPAVRIQQALDAAEAGFEAEAKAAAIRARMAAPPAMAAAAPPLMSPAATALYPYSSYPGYGVIHYAGVPAAAYGMMLMPAPTMSAAAAGGYRSPAAALVPLPPQAYSGLSDALPGSPPPLLTLPPLSRRRALLAPPLQSPLQLPQQSAQVPQPQQPPLPPGQVESKIQLQPLPPQQQQQQQQAAELSVPSPPTQHQE